MAGTRGDTYHYYVVAAVVKASRLPPTTGNPLLGYRPARWRSGRVAEALPLTSGFPDPSDDSLALSQVLGLLAGLLA